jgi:ribosomal protein L44E
VRLPLPAAWRAEHAIEEIPRFTGGVLNEPKYQAFRHDLLVASFHPGHRAQWTAHELCHGLVGFAYRPGATSLFHALAAWLAELLPVSLWYFFDEAELRRCGRHRGGGPLFRDYCEDCEEHALKGPRRADAERERQLTQGKRYLQRELAAIARSRRSGRPQGTRFATIDLAEDALRYTAAHARRLKAPAMERFVGQFFAPEQGHHGSLEALEARVLEVSAALTDGAPARAWRATGWDYAAQDIGYRLLGVRESAKGEVLRELDRIIDKLALNRTERGIEATIRAYGTLFGASQRRLPSSEDLFAVGYDLPRGFGRSQRQLADGVASACPRTWAALGKRRLAMAQAFCAADEPRRQPIGRRFAAFLSRVLPGPLADLAQLEAAITHAAPPDSLRLGLDPREARGTGLALARGVELVHLDYDVLELSGQRVVRARKLRRPHALLVLRSADREVDVLELSPELAERLERSRQKQLSRRDFEDDPDALEALISCGALVPTAYAE